MAEDIQAEQVEYTADTIDRWLKSWTELESRAEHVKSPSAFQVALPCPTRGRFAHGNALEIIADIELAHAQLHRDGVAWAVIELRKRGVGSMSAIARAMAKRKEDVRTGYQQALERMAAYLNGTCRAS